MMLFPFKYPIIFIRGFNFACHKINENEKMLIAFLYMRHFFTIQKKANNTGYNFCVLNVLRCRNKWDISQNLIFAKITPDRWCLFQPKLQRKKIQYLFCPIRIKNYCAQCTQIFTVVYTTNLSILQVKDTYLLPTLYTLLND